jgi:IclR family transcriptional regulator, acetate operon repressor
MTGATEPGTAGGPPEDVHRSGAQTVERAVAILNLFRDGRSALGISAIARATQLHLSTAHRLVKTLVHEQFMEQDPVTEQYRLGAAIAILGQRALQSSGLDAARPVIDRVAESSGESVSLGVLRGNDVVVVLHSASRHGLRFDHPTGGAINVHGSAMGKTLLAFSAQGIAAVVAALGDLPRFTDATITDHDILTSELEQVRVVGYATNREERYTGVCGIAAPVLDLHGIARYAIGVQGPSVRLSEARLLELAPLVIEAAHSIADVVLRS